MTKSEFTEKVAGVPMVTFIFVDPPQSEVK